MLVSAKDMMEKARDGKYAVGQFNINNLEWTKAILNTAQKLNSPVILGVSGGAGKYMTGFKVVADMVKAMDESLGITVPVALHLDHGTYDQCYDCIKAGFTSIMFDGSHFPIEENLAKTKELVAVAHKLGLSIESEVGAIGCEEDGVIGRGECADPQECKTIADLGVDILAAGIGNIHGVYPANWEGLSFETLEAVKKAVGDMPLVLHGVAMMYGAEANVMDTNGGLDFAQSRLRAMDWVVASIHSPCIPGLLTEKEATRLWLAVAENPYVDCIGHSEQQNYRYDYDLVTKAFAKNHKVVELNGNSVNVRRDGISNMKLLLAACLKNGCHIALDTDAHSTTQLQGNMPPLLAMLEEMQFPQELVVNATRQNLVNELKLHGRICAEYIGGEIL